MNDWSIVKEIDGWHQDHAQKVLKKFQDRAMLWSHL